MREECNIKKDHKDIKVGDIVFTFYPWKFLNDEIIVPFKVKEFIDETTVYIKYVGAGKHHDVTVRSLDNVLTLDELKEKVKDFDKRFG